MKTVNTMKKIFRVPRLLLAALLLVSVAMIARVPMNDRKTMLEDALSTFTISQPDEEEKQKQGEESRQSLDQVWSEIEKIAEANADDSVTITGTIKLYDNLDEEGISEEQRFLLQQAGANQRFRLENFERVEVNHSLLLIDHAEKEVVVQAAGKIDSLMNTIKMLSPQKFRELLIKDGTTASISTEGSNKVLHIVPGAMDAVNEYHLFYDSVTFNLKKLRLSYTNFPFQDYLDTGMDNIAKKNIQSQAAAKEEDGYKSDEVEIEANITEYVVEFFFESKEKKSMFNFQDNELFKVDAHKFQFKGKLSQYKQINY